MHARLSSPKMGFVERTVFCGHAKNAQGKRTIIIRGSPFWIERAFQESDFLKKCEEEGEKRFLFVFLTERKVMNKQGKKKFFSCSKRPALGVLFYKEREHKPQRRKENGRVEKMGDFGIIILILVP